MKSSIQYTVIFISVFIALAAVPVLSVKNIREVPDNDPISNISENAEEPGQKFNILNSSTGEIVSIDEKEFLYGTVAYEVPPTFEEEAIKAQAVAAYTFFSYKRMQQKNSPDSDQGVTDFAADLDNGELYMSDSVRHEKWGSAYNDSMEKIRKCCDSVYGEIITDRNGNPIDAAYHAISSGKTENAADIFGKAQSYLTAVASPGDIYAPDYITDPRFTADEFRSRIRAIDSGFSFKDSPESYIKNIDRTQSGSVINISICGKNFTGSQIRAAFSLRSTNFEVTYKEGMFVFLVRGYGHGVGMSQYGAQAMAQNGADYHEILAHYYNGCGISKMESGVRG